MKVISVCDFGVVPNIKTAQTEKIQAAIDYAFADGGGEVQIPTGEYYIGGLRLRSNVCLHLMKNAILIASRNIEDYSILKNDTIEPVEEDEFDESTWVRVGGAPATFHKMASRWHNGVIRALNAKNISIIGEEGAVIDGMNCFDEKGEEYYRGPHGISILNCDNVILKGYTVRNSGNWANMLQNCTNIVAENLIVEAGHDGIHFTSCDNVTVRGCHFHTGDDCVAGYDIHNMLVEECILNSACSAFRLGGTNILIQNCHAYAPAKYMFRGTMSDEEKRAGILANDSKDTVPRENMLSFYTYFAELATKIRSTPGNIIIRNCKVDGADRFLHFNYSGNEPWQNNRPLTKITFENIKASGISMPLTAYGDRKEQCDIILRDINFSYREGFENTTFMHAANLSHLCMKDITIQNGAGGTLVKLWGDVMPETDLENIKGNIDENYIVPTTEAFVCQAI